LQEPLVLIAPKNRGCRNEVDVLATFQIESLVRGEIEPSPDGQIYLVNKTADCRPGISIPGRVERIQRRVTLSERRRLTDHCRAIPGGGADRNRHSELSLF